MARENSYESEDRKGVKKLKKPERYRNGWKVRKLNENTDSYGKKDHPQPQNKQTTQQQTNKKQNEKTKEKHTRKNKKQNPKRVAFLTGLLILESTCLCYEFRALINSLVCRFVCGQQLR